MVFPGSGMKITWLGLGKEFFLLMFFPKSCPNVQFYCWKCPYVLSRSSTDSDRNRPKAHLIYPDLSTQAWLKNINISPLFHASKHWKHSFNQLSPAYKPTQPPFCQPPDMKVSIHQRILNIIWHELYKCQYGAYDRYR